MKEYGELMNLLLYFRERNPGEEEFREFMINSIRTFVYDLRDFNIEVALSINSTQKPAANHWRTGEDRELVRGAIVE
jgi:hypothetical protein